MLKWDTNNEHSVPCLFSLSPLRSHIISILFGFSCLLFFHLYRPKWSKYKAERNCVFSVQRTPNKEIRDDHLPDINVFVRTYKNKPWAELQRSFVFFFFFDFKTVIIRPIRQCYRFTFFHRWCTGAWAAETNFLQIKI